MIFALAGASITGAGYATNRNNLTWASGLTATASYSISARIDFLKNEEIDEYKETIGLYEESLEEMEIYPF